jgi:hypothetical protein
MGLQQKLDAFKAEFLRTAPAGRPALYETKIDELRASFALDRAIRTGEQAPEFTLPDQRGKGVSLATLLGSGPAVATFYRGGWCSYCNIQLRAYQAVLPACVDGPVDARAKLGNLTGGSIAVMCPACWRGCMAAGPDGFRDPAPNNDAAWLAGRCEYRVLRIVGSTDRHLTQLCHPGINARSGAVG